MEQQFKIEKLRDDSNWKQWQFVITTLLDSDDLLEICDGSTPKPVENKEPDKWKEWNTKNKLAKKLIVTSVETKVLDYIIHCKDANEMWNKLHSIFQSKVEENLESVQKQFFEYRWNSNSSVANHIHNLELMTTTMKKLGGEIPSSMLMTRIMSTLPPEYKKVHDLWNSVDLCKRNLDNLRALLLKEEIHLKTPESKVVKKTPKVDKVQENNIKCSKCYRVGHFRKQCSSFCYSCGSLDHITRNCLRKVSTANLLLKENCFKDRKVKEVAELNSTVVVTNKQNKKCRKCGGDGHIQVNCRYVNCFKCGQEGHIKPNCPNKLYEKKFKVQNFEGAKLNNVKKSSLLSGQSNCRKWL